MDSVGGVNKLLHGRATYFVVVTAGRSGSSFLCDALRSHPHVVCFGELFEDVTTDTVRDKDVCIRELGPDEGAGAYCSDAVFSPVLGPYNSFGFKAKYYHFASNDLEKFIVEHGVRVVHNTRRNLIAQSLSLPLAERHEFSAFLGDPDHTGVYVSPIRVDVEDVIARAESNGRKSAVFASKFAGKVPLLELAYEEICTSDEVGILAARSAVGRLLDFLEVERRELRSTFVKQRTIPYDDLIENFDELVEVARRRHPEWEESILELEETYA